MIRLIKQMKEEMGRQQVSQRVLADKVDLTEATICRYFKGSRVPNIEDFEKMAEVLGMRVELVFPTSTNKSQIGSVIGRRKTMKTISEQVQEIANEICDKYCKYPENWDSEKEGCELFESEICKNCPLNRL